MNLQTKERVSRLEEEGNIDADVAEFGGYSPSQLRKPESRNGFYFIETKEEALRNICENALSRATHFSYCIGDLPPVQFPNAEHFQHIPFTNEHWKKYGNLETERNRISFMLENYKSRQFPTNFIPICKTVLESDDVLREWSNQFRTVDNTRRQIYKDLEEKMVRNREAVDGSENGGHGAYQSLPKFYDVSEESVGLEKKLWEKALEQIQKELREKNARNLSSFLHLYRHIKDPVAPIRSNFTEQIEIFQRLYEASETPLKNVDRTSEQEKILVTQLALESSFLALPLAGEIEMVVYQDAHEIPYAYTEPTELPRGEFSDPERSITILKELIEDSNAAGVARMTPLAVSYFQGPYQKRPELFIVDGNNRATAILLMKYFSFLDFNEKDIKDYEHCISKFVALHDLDIEWERDLTTSLEWILSDSSAEQGAELDYILTYKTIIEEFSNSLIPIMITQEPNYHTVAVALSDDKNIILLHPSHQALYNQTRGGVAIPSKKQTHGRVLGNAVTIVLKKKE